MNHQLLSVPEADRVAVVEWIPVRLRDVVAAIGIDPPDVIDHLVDQPRLVWCDDELAQKRLCQPAGMARRGAGGDRIPLDAFPGVRDPLQHLRVKLRSQFGGGQAVRGLIRIEGKARDGSPRVDAAPVGHAVRSQALPGLRLLAKRPIEL